MLFSRGCIGRSVSGTRLCGRSPKKVFQIRATASDWTVRGLRPGRTAAYGEWTGPRLNYLAGQPKKYSGSSYRLARDFAPTMGLINSLRFRDVFSFKRAVMARF
jgi:hypothetical protein